MVSLDRSGTRAFVQIQRVSPWLSPACAVLLLGIGYGAGGSPLVLLAIAGLIALGTVAPRGPLIILPASLGLAYQPLQIGLGAARLNPAEILVVSTAAGVSIRVAWTTLSAPANWRAQFAALRSWFANLRFSAIAAGLLVAGAVSLGTVADPEHRRESLREFRWVVLEPVVAYFLCCWFLRRRDDRWRALGGWALASAAIALYSIGAGLAGSGLAVEGVVRIRGLHPHPNALALYLERPLILAAAIALAVTGRSRWLWAIPAVISAGALVLTYSRGALLSVLLTVLLVGWLTRHHRLTVAFAAGSTVAITGLILAAPERFLSLFQGGSGSLRLNIWGAALAMIRDYTIFGVGLDQFLYQYAPRYVAPEAWPERFTSHPHNLLLDAWLRLGLMGVALLICAAVALLRCLRSAAREASSLGLAAGLAVVAGAVHGLVDNGYFLPDLALAFWLLAAILDLELSRRAAVVPAPETG